MAFTDLKVDNFTITDSLVFKNTTYPSHQNNYAFCQVRIKQHPSHYHHYQKLGKILWSTPSHCTLMTNHVYDGSANHITAFALHSMKIEIYEKLKLA